jgi:hypothetical protein
MFTTRSALGGLAFVVLASTTAEGQDPWSRVPPLPQSCYDANPGFVQQLQNISHELTVEMDRQAGINSEITQKSINMDMTEKQQKMMAFMQKNPTEAGKMMQDIAMAGQKSGQDVERLKERTQAFDEQLKSAEKLYATDNAVLDGIQKKYLDAENLALARQLAAQYNTEYEKLCAKWLKSESSPLLKYLADYKRYLVEEQIPMDEERAQWAKKEFTLYGVPSTGYKSTAVPKAVTDYLGAMITVYGRRNTAPKPVQ